LYMEKKLFDRQQMASPKTLCEKHARRNSIPPHCRPAIHILA
jgi:hypothetical protein